MSGTADPASCREGLSKAGILEWFRPGERDRVEEVVAGLGRLGIRRLRTGVSWADYHTREGPGWYDWLLPRLARDLDLLPCFTYTPPSLGIVEKASAPPRDLKAYADFLDVMITDYGRHFEWVELWNEPNNLNDWDWRLDPSWRRFAAMVEAAACWARKRGKRTVLGGMCPTDPNWLELMAGYGVMDHIDVVGLHAFPGTWQHEGETWDHLIGVVLEALERHGLTPHIWVTEVGYSTWRHDEIRQVECFLDALRAPAERVYWYAYQDLDPELESQEGFHVDERHYHLGLVDARGRPKLLHRLLEKGGIRLLDEVRAAEMPAGPSLHLKPYAVVTGGAGFVGCQLADRLASQGRRVLLYDSLARPGTEANLLWVHDRHADRLGTLIADLRDRYALREALVRADTVFHLGGQVAVTTSLEDPMTDFEVNLLGTVELLEQARRRAEPPAVILASTNKVYGELPGMALVEEARRWSPTEASLRDYGIGEDQPLAFHSPYGCSKGAADQYALDYARCFGMAAVVLRKSCIYGPRQLGTEDQGWVAHFARCALEGRDVTVFGDGKQVRDLLFIDDLLDAYLIAERCVGRLAGRAFNIGGGPSNAASLLELLDHLEALAGRPIGVRIERPRAGDQVWYVSDTRRFEAATGWRPRSAVAEGLPRLLAWLRGCDRSAPEHAGSARP